MTSNDDVVTSVVRGGGGLKHIGIIMDGNRRYSRERGIPLKFAHVLGATIFMELVEFLASPVAKRDEVAPNLRGLKEVTFYALSLDNVAKRSSDEIEGIKKILSNMISVLMANDNLFKKGSSIKIKFVGEYRNVLDVELSERIQELEEKCYVNSGSADADDTNITVNIALCYDWYMEIIRASETANQLGDEYRMVDFIPLKSQMDLVIRTGGVSRTSGFFPLNTVYSEWVFSDLMWPEFTLQNFFDTCETFDGANRRFGV